MTSSSCLNSLMLILKNRIIKQLISLTLLPILAAFSLHGYAYEPPILFKENFENGLSGYITSGNVSLSGDDVILRGGSDSHITKKIDVTNYARIYLEATASVYGLDYGEFYKISFSVDGVNFVELKSDREAATNFIITHFPSWASNQSLYIRFELSASSYFERFTIDYFRVRGDYIHNIPENPPVDETDNEEPDPSSITQFTGGPNNNTLITAPSTINEARALHPVFIWGPATGQNPEADTELLEHIASQGFIVLSQYSSGNGSEMTEALEWLLVQDTTPSSPLYQSVNSDLIAVGGHSRGARSALGASDDYRIKTSILVTGASKFYSAGPDSLQYSALFIAGADDGYTTSDMLDDYAEATVPSVFTIIEGVDQDNVNQVSPAMISSWLRWQLLGESERKDEFVGLGCDYCQAPYSTQSKNFN